jgi:hypothetical protein
MVRRCVWSINLMHEEDIAPVGPQHQRKNYVMKLHDPMYPYASALEATAPTVFMVWLRAS